MDGHNGKYERLLSLQAEVTQAYRDLGCTGEPEPQPPQPIETFYQPTPGIDCHCCDFRNLPVEPGTVDAVVTDIPWDEKWLRHVPEFAKWCAKVLKHNGVLVTWYGQLFLDRCMEGLSQHLHYQWMFVSPFYGSSQNKSNFITARYRPAVVYSVSKELRLHRATDDWCPGSLRVKGLHEHQQPVPPTQFLVEAFSQEGSTICDPCAGSFTTAEACYLTNRRFIGGDINPECLGMARTRFNALGLLSPVGIGKANGKELDESVARDIPHTQCPFCERRIPI